MKNIAAHEPECPFQIEWAHDLPPEHGGLEIRSMAVDEIDHHVRHFLAMRIPGSTVRQDWRDMLAEQARHVLARRRKAIVESRGNENLNDRPLRPAAGLGIEIGLVHVGKTR